MEEKRNDCQCPNCKNPINQESLIPVYTKSQDSKNTNRFNIPNRPKGERTENTNRSNVI